MCSSDLVPCSGKDGSTSRRTRRNVGSDSLAGRKRQNEARLLPIQRGASNRAEGIRACRQGRTPCRRMYPTRQERSRLGRLPSAELARLASSPNTFADYDVVLSGRNTSRKKNGHRPSRFLRFAKASRRCYTGQPSAMDLHESPARELADSSETNSLACITGNDITSYHR